MTHCHNPGIDDLAKPIQSFDHKNWSYLGNQNLEVRFKDKARGTILQKKTLIISFVCVKIQFCILLEHYSISFACSKFLM